MINIDSRLLSELDANEMYLLLNLTNRINGDRFCYPGNKLLCSELKWSKEKLQQVKKRLTEKKIIEIEKRYKENGPGQTSNIYRVLTPQVGNYSPGGKNGTGEVGKSASPQVGISDSPQVGKSGMAPVGKPGNEVLISEELNNQVLTIEELEREKEFLLIDRYDVFKEIILFMYPHLEDAGYRLSEEDDEERIKDPNTRNLIKKIRGAARDLYSAFDEMKKPIPMWRNWQSVHNGKKDGALDPKQDAIDHVQSYAEFCRVTQTYKTSDPEKLTEKILQADWCLKLKEYADSKFPNQYDPMDDFNASPDWIMWYFYEQQMVYVDKSNSKRIF